MRTTQTSKEAGIRMKIDEVVMQKIQEILSNFLSDPNPVYPLMIDGQVPGLKEMKSTIYVGVEEALESLEEPSQPNFYCHPKGRYQQA